MGTLADATNRAIIDRIEIKRKRNAVIDVIKASSANVIREKEIPSWPPPKPLCDGLRFVESDRDGSLFEISHRSALAAIMLRELKLSRMIDIADFYLYEFCRIYEENADPEKDDFSYCGLALILDMHPGWHYLLKRLEEKYALTVKTVNIPDMCEHYTYITPYYNWEDPGIWLPIKEMIENAR